MKHRRASLRVVAAIVFVTLGLVASGLPAQGAPPADPTVTSPTAAEAKSPPPAPVTLPTPPEVQAALDVAPPAPSEPAPSLDDTQLVTPPDLGPAPQGAEIVDRRTATTKTFATDRPGEFVTEISSEAVHYQADGHWQDIDTELVAGKDGRLHNKAGAFDLSVATKATDASVARLGLDATHSVGFSLEGAANAKGKATEEATTFSGARKDTQLRLTSRPNGLKEELVLASAAAPDRFVFPLQLKGLTASIDGDGNVIYRDESGLERARTPHGYMYDANVDPRSGEAPTSYGVDFALIASGKGGTALEVTLDRAWLDDPARQYPVVVDPEFVTATGADDTYVMSNIAPNSAATETELKVGTYDGGTHVARAFLHFNTAPISGKVIQWGRLDIAERHSYNCANVGPTPYRVTESWTGSTLTTWPGKPIDVPAGGSLNAVSGSCPNRLFSADMNGASANWASGAWTNLGIALVAPSESNSNYYKRFASFDSGAPPALHVGWTEPTATVPSAPQSLVATARNLSASVTWAAPASNGGAAVDNYIVYAYNYPAGTPAGPYSYACGTCTSTTVAGLTNGQQYYFAAYAHNAIGWGAVAGSNVVVPAPQPPTPPQSPSATPRNTSAIVSWAPSADNGGSAILDYTVFIYPYPSLSPVTYTVACATCTSANVPNLTNGQQYIFGIYARNAVNYSTGVATNIVTPAITTPSAPTNAVATAGNTSAALTWTAPTDNGGSAITASYAMAYTLNPLTYAPDKFVAVCATCTSGVITGLTNGVAYQFLVFASNSAGNGAYTWSNIVTPMVPPTTTTTTSTVPPTTTTSTVPPTTTTSTVPPTTTTSTVPPTTTTSTVPPTTTTSTVPPTTTTSTVPPTTTTTMPILPLDPPLDPAATLVGPRTAKVTWTRPQNDAPNASPIVGYTIEVSCIPCGGTEVIGNPEEAIITGLSPFNSPYVFVVIARNERDQTSRSQVSASLSIPADKYAAMGDSYSSGEGTADDAGPCQQSPGAYGPLFATYLNPTILDLTFTACTGITSSQLLDTQLPTVPTDVGLVTFTIGGNDLGFGDVLTGCTVLANCEIAFADADELIDEVQPVLEDTYEAVLAHATGAQVVVLSYPQIFSDDFDACTTELFIDPLEKAWLRGLIVHMDQVIRDAVDAVNDPRLSLLSLLDSFSGHEICTEDAYVNGVSYEIPNSFHPNSAGHVAIASDLQSHLAQIGWYP